MIKKIICAFLSIIILYLVVNKEIKGMYKENFSLIEEEYETESLDEYFYNTDKNISTIIEESSNINIEEDTKNLDGNFIQNNNIG